MMVLRFIGFTVMLGWLLGCSSGQRLVQVIVDKNQESAEHREENQTERQEDIRNTVSRHERDGATPEEIRRAMLQEWIDHQQSAWVPVAVLSFIHRRQLFHGEGDGISDPGTVTALQSAV